MKGFNVDELFRTYNRGENIKILLFATPPAMTSMVMIARIDSRAFETGLCLLRTFVLTEMMFATCRFGQVKVLLSMGRCTSRRLPTTMCKA